MKKLWLVLLLLIGVELCAQQQTTNLGLTIVPHGFPNYDVPVNANMRTIDSAVGLLQNMWQGTWSGASTYGKGQVVIFSSSLFVSRVNLNVNNQPDTHPVQWMSIGIGTGGGTVTNVSVAGLTGLFTANVASPTATPSVTYSAVSFSAHNFFGNCTSGSASPTACQPNFTDLAGTASTGQLPGVTVFTNQSNTFASNQKQIFTAGGTNSGLRLAGISGGNPTVLASGDHWYRTDIGDGRLMYQGVASVHQVMNTDDTIPFSQLSGTIANGQLMASPTFSGTVTSGSGGAGGFITLSSGATTSQSDVRGMTVAGNRCFGLTSTSSAADGQVALLGSTGAGVLTSGFSCGVANGTFSAGHFFSNTDMTTPSLALNGSTLNAVHGNTSRIQLSDNLGPNGFIPKYDAAGNLTDSGLVVSSVVTSVAGSSPISSSGGTTPSVSCPTCVTSVAGSAPVSSSGGTTPSISCPTCVTSVGAVSPISSSGGTSPSIQLVAGVDGQCLNTLGGFPTWGSCAGTAGQQDRTAATGLTFVNAATTNFQTLKTFNDSTGAYNISGKHFVLTALGDISADNSTAPSPIDVTLCLSGFGGSINCWVIPHQMYNTVNGANNFNFTYMIVADCKVLTTGSSGSLFCTLSGEIGLGSSTSGSPRLNLSWVQGSPYNLTTGGNFSTLVAFSTATTNNFADQRYFHVEMLN